MKVNNVSLGNVKTRTSIGGKSINIRDLCVLLSFYHYYIFIIFLVENPCGEYEFTAPSFGSKTLASPKSLGVACLWKITGQLGKRLVLDINNVFLSGKLDYLEMGSGHDQTDDMSLIVSTITLLCLVMFPRTVISCI